MSRWQRNKNRIFVRVISFVMAGVFLGTNVIYPEANKKDIATKYIYGLEHRNKQLRLPLGIAEKRVKEMVETSSDIKRVEGPIGDNSLEKTGIDNDIYTTKTQAETGDTLPEDKRDVLIPPFVEKGIQLRDIISRRGTRCLAFSGVDLNRNRDVTVKVDRGFLDAERSGKTLFASVMESSATNWYKVGLVGHDCPGIVQLFDAGTIYVDVTNNVTVGIHYQILETFGDEDLDRCIENGFFNSLGIVKTLAVLTDFVDSFIWLDERGLARSDYKKSNFRVKTEGDAMGKIKQVDLDTISEYNHFYIGDVFEIIKDVIETVYKNSDIDRKINLFIQSWDRKKADLNTMSLKDLKADLEKLREVIAGLPSSDTTAISVAYSMDGTIDFVNLLKLKFPECVEAQQPIRILNLRTDGDTRFASNLNRVLINNSINATCYAMSSGIKENIAPAVESGITCIDGTIFDTKALKSLKNNIDVIIISAPDNISDLDLYFESIDSILSDKGIGILLPAGTSFIFKVWFRQSKTKLEILNIRLNMQGFKDVYILDKPIIFGRTGENVDSPLKRLEDIRRSDIGSQM